MKARLGFLGLFLVGLTNSASATPVELKLWHSYTGGERQALDQALAALAESSPGFTVRSSFVPFGALADKLTAAIPRGHGPDAFIFAHDRIGGWVEGRLLEPVELFVDEPMLDRHHTPCVFALAYGDSLYGLPLAFKALALFIRKDLVKEVPPDAQSLLKLAKKMTIRKEGRFGFVYPIGDFFFHTPFLYSMGGTIFNPNTKTPNVQNKGVIRSLALAKKIHEQGLLPDDPTPVVAASMFVDGRTPMIINGPWFLDSVKDKVPFMVAPIPAWPNGTQASGFSSCEGIMMSRHSKHKRHAFKLMSFLANDLRSAEARMLVGGQTVTLHEAWTQSLPKLSENIQTVYQAFQTAFKHSKTSPSYPSMNAVWGPMNAALYNTIHKNVTPSAAAADAQRRIMKALGK